MSIYNLSPSPQQAEPFAFWERGFGVDELTRIRNEGDAMLDPMSNLNATVGAGELLVDVRRSQIGWFTTENAIWLYDKLGWIVRQLNGQYFQFDLTGFSEHMQYTYYSSTYQGHYDWHVDAGRGPDVAPRKLSLIVQLSAPDEYEGGDVELMYKQQAEVLSRDQGIVYAFPSWMLHRVMPVTAGTRRSLVVWLSGPRWR
ncbi:MAG: 2OG-Fe(II) oxygenase [Candidatus Dormibacteria bacterium]